MSGNKLAFGLGRLAGGVVRKLVGEPAAPTEPQYVLNRPATAAENYDKNAGSVKAFADLRGTSVSPGSALMKISAMKFDEGTLKKAPRVHSRGPDARVTSVGLKQEDIELTDVNIIPEFAYLLNHVEQQLADANLVHTQYPSRAQHNLQHIAGIEMALLGLKGQMFVLNGLWEGHAAGRVTTPGFHAMMDVIYQQMVDLYRNSIEHSCRSQLIALR